MKVWLALHIEKVHTTIVGVFSTADKAKQACGNWPFRVEGEWEQTSERTYKLGEYTETAFYVGEFEIDKEYVS